MNRAEFHKIMTKLKSVYTQSNFLASADAYDAWYRTLGKSNSDRLLDAINKYIGANKMPPAPSDIKELLSRNDEQEPIYARMVLWGLYDQDGNEENEVYASSSMSNLEVKAWFGKSQDVEGYTVRAKLQKAIGSPFMEANNGNKQKRTSKEAGLDEELRQFSVQDYG